MNNNPDNYYPALPQAPTSNPVMVTLSLDDFLRLQQQQSSLGQPLAPIQQQQQQPLFVFHQQQQPPTLLPLGPAASHPSHLQPVPLMFPSHPPTVLPVAHPTFGAARPVATTGFMGQQALPPPPPYASATTPPPHLAIKNSASDEGGLSSSDGGAAMVPKPRSSARGSVPFGDSVTSMPALAQTKTTVSLDQSPSPASTPPTTTVVVPPPHPAMCRHFKRGRCNRHNCRFVHDDVWFQANLAAKRERKVQQMVLEAEAQLTSNRQREGEEGGQREEQGERNHKELVAAATANAANEESQAEEPHRDAFCSGDDCDDSLAEPLHKANLVGNDKKKPSLPTGNDSNGGPIAFLRDATDPFARTASLNAALSASSKKTCLSDQKLTHPSLNAALLLLNGGTAVSNAPGVASGVGAEGAAMVVEDLTNSGKSAKTHASDATYKSHSMSAAALLAIDPAPIRFESDLKHGEEEQTSAVEESSSGEYELTEG